MSARWIRYTHVVGRAATYLVILYFSLEALVFLFFAFISALPSRNCVMEECSLIRWDRAPIVLLLLSIAALFAVLARKIAKGKRWAFHASAGIFAVQLIQWAMGEYRYGVQIGNGFALPIVQDMSPIGPYIFDFMVTCCAGGGGEHALSINLVALVGLIALTLIGVTGQLGRHESAR